VNLFNSVNTDLSMNKLFNSVNTDLSMNKLPVSFHNTLCFLSTDQMHTMNREKDIIEALRYSLTNRPSANVYNVYFT
jgi:Ca2+-binding EF-hand superfamily protein